MRRLTDAELVRQLMRALGAEADEEVRIYFTGGTTAVLFGWRPTTIDVDLKLVPESERLLRAIPRLKEQLSVNIELASPADFIPELRGWEERSLFIAQEGRVSFYHYDLYAQALAKIERGHNQDLDDVRQMFRRGLIDPSEVRRRFQEIESGLYRYPAVDPRSFRQALDEALKEAAGFPCGS